MSIRLSDSNTRVRTWNYLIKVPVMAGLKVSFGDDEIYHADFFATILPFFIEHKAHPGIMYLVDILKTASIIPGWNMHLKDGFSYFKIDINVNESSFENVKDIPAFSAAGVNLSAGDLLELLLYVLQNNDLTSPEDARLLFLSCLGVKLPLTQIDPFAEMREQAMAEQE